jgi:Skp family chaperone for outer membrane proteins
MAGACALAAAWPADAAAPVKVAIVDADKALADTADGKAARITLEKDFATKSKLLEAKKEEVKAASEALEKKRALLTPPALAAEEEKLRKLYAEAELLASTLSGDFEAKKRDLTAPLYARLECILRKVGEADGYTLILPREGVLWAPEHLDLTSELTRKYEAGLCKDAKPKPAGMLGAPALTKPAAAGAAPKGGTAAPKSK